MPISLGFWEWGCPKRSSLPSFFLFASLPPFSRTFHFNFASSPLYNLRALNRLLYFCLIIVIILDIFTPIIFAKVNTRYHRSKYCKNPSADWQMSTPVQAGKTTLSLLVIVVIVIIIIIYFIDFFLYFNICIIIYHVPHV